MVPTRTIDLLVCIDCYLYPGVRQNMGRSAVSPRKEANDCHVVSIIEGCYAAGADKFLPNLPSTWRNSQQILHS